MLLRTVVCIAIALEPWCNRRWCRFRIPAELRLLPSVRYYRGQITDIREFSRHCSHVRFVKQGKVVRFSVGVILRKATYVYVTAVYQGAILDGCWGEMGRGEKRNNIFLSSPPSPSSLPLLTDPRRTCGNLFLSPIFLWFRNSRRRLNISRRKYGACYF